MEFVSDHAIGRVYRCLARRQSEDQPALASIK
jgi:hypothetical protein